MTPPLEAPLKGGRFDPPAPVVRVLVTGEGGSATCEALLDTGADITVLPLGVAAAVGFNSATAETVEAGGFTDDPADVPVGEFAVRLAGRDSEVWALVVDRPFALLGRDVLRHYVLTFDGPAERLTVADPAGPA